VVLRLKLFRAATPLVAVILLSADAFPAIAAEVTVELLAEASLPGDLEIDHTRVGGLSGLTYDPGCDLFYAISDDRGSLAAPRFYSLTIRLDGETPEVKVLEAILLREADGSTFSRGSIDAEALALPTDGDLFVASEGIPHRGIEPLVGRFRLDGTFEEALGLPEHFLPDAGATRGVRDNLGFEGLAVSPDGTRLFAAAENALIQDGPAADLDRGSPARIVVFELPSGRPIAEYLYDVGPVPDRPFPASAFRTNGISEIVALGNDQLLVVERSFSVGFGNRIRLYEADLHSGTDISDIESLRLASGVVPVAKTLVADLGELGVKPDNIEGMALGPMLPNDRRLLVLIADNNFQPLFQKNQVLLLAVTGAPRPIVSSPDAAIHEIQGAAQVSPFVGRCVSGVEGQVTAILGSRGGQAFWMQSPGSGDGDPRTSEGLFVTALRDLPTADIGDLVRLDGRVEERAWGYELPVTRLVASEIEILGHRHHAPSSVVIGSGGVEIPQPNISSPQPGVFDPARYAADAFESLEGMLVRIDEPVVVGPTSRYGEVTVLADSGRGASLRTERGGLRVLDDNFNPQRIVIDDRLIEGPPNLSVADSLNGPVGGVLHYSFGSYKILNTRPIPGVREGGLVQERTALTAGDSRLTVATFNLENLSAVSEERKFERLAAIVAKNLGGPDVIAVQEVQDDTGPEDDGTVTATRTLALLVEAIEAAGGPRYATRSIDPSDGADGGQRGGNIRSAFLFNPERLEFVERRSCEEDSETRVAEGPVLTCSPGLVDPGNRAFRGRERGRDGNRKPLVGEFTFRGDPLFLIDLHLKSKSGDDPLFGRRQPRTEVTRSRRTDQARVVADFVNMLIAADPTTRIVVLGDLNDFENSEPLLTLESAGLEDLVKELPLESRYTYVHLGNSQVLDHILVSQALADSAEIDIVHVNAEFPASERASDHDPVIVRLSFEP
jgi:endonuclease/exonuclease/phosphatase family metal-dependent hydrolase